MRRFQLFSLAVIVLFITRGSFFERPVGVNADFMDLEYIAALHQTGDANHEALR